MIRSKISGADRNVSIRTMSATSPTRALATAGSPIAKYLVVLVKGKGAPILTPVK